MKNATAETPWFHIPPAYILGGVVVFCLVVALITDFIKQRFGCCGARGRCCSDLPADICPQDLEAGQAIPLAPMRANPVRLESIRVS